MRKTSQMNAQNPKKFEPTPAKFIIGTFIILFAVTGCSDMPYIGANLTNLEVDRYLVSTDGESVCFQDDLDTTCIRFIPGIQNIVEANNHPAIYIYPERRVYTLYHEGVPILRAERAQIAPISSTDTQGNTSDDNPSTPNGQTGNSNGNNNNNNNGGGNTGNNNNNNGGGNTGNNNNAGGDNRNNNGGGNTGNNNSNNNSDGNTGNNGSSNTGNNNNNNNGGSNNNNNNNGNGNNGNNNNNNNGGGNNGNGDNGNNNNNNNGDGNNGNNNNAGGNNNGGGGNNGNNNNNNNGGGNNGNNNNGNGDNGNDSVERTNGDNNNNRNLSNNNDDGHGWIIWVYYPEGTSPRNAPTLSESGVTVTINGKQLTDEDITGFAQFIGSGGERGVQFFYQTKSAELLDLKIRIEGVVSDDETVKFNINYLWNAQ